MFKSCPLHLFSSTSLAETKGEERRPETSMTYPNHPLTLSLKKGKGNEKKKAKKSLNAYSPTDLSKKCILYFN